MANRTFWTPLGISRYDLKVLVFPTVSLRPVKGESDRGAGAQVCRRHINDVNSHARVARFRIAGGSPIVFAPMHPGRRERLDSQRFAGNHLAATVIESPHDP